MATRGVVTGIHGGDRAPAALLLAAPLLLVNLAAIWGQAGWAYDHITSGGWGGVVVALVFAFAVESIGVYLAWEAHESLMADQASAFLRFGSYAVGLLVGLLNFLHFSAQSLAAGVAFGGLSAVSPWLWGIWSRARNRTRLAELGLVDVRGVKLSTARKIWHPIRSVRVLSWAAWEGITDPAAAVAGWQEADDADQREEAVAERVAGEVGLPFAPLTPRQTACHVYRLYDAEAALLYVGVGFDVADRCRSHKYKKAWWPEVVRGSVTTYPTRTDALVAERMAIADEEPRYNIMPGCTADHASGWPSADWTPSDPVATRENIPPEELHAPERSSWVADDQTLADRVVQWAAEEGSMPSRERVRTRFNVGSKRAERIRGLAVELQESAPPSDPAPTGRDESDPGPDPLAELLELTEQDKRAAERPTNGVSP